jgi:hypothetical protein
MDVDEARTDDAARGLHDLGRRRVRELADRHDPISADTDVGGHPGRSGAIDNGPATDEQIEVHRVRPASRERGAG